MTCVHNLRSALDNLVYEFAVAYHSGSLASDFEERLMFPIFDSPKGFKDKGAYRLKGIAPDARKVIEELQPYNREPKWPACDPLWKLNELSKRDKHRLPPVASLATVQALGFFVPEVLEIIHRHIVRKVLPPLSPYLRNLE